MIHMGQTARLLREAFGLTQHEAAQRLGVSNVHISRIETDKAAPSPALIDRYREVFGVDLYVFAWCRYGDVERLPEPIQKAARTLMKAWQAQIKNLTAEASP